MLIDGRGRWYRWQTKPTVGEYLCMDIGVVSRALGLDRRAGGMWRWELRGDKEATVAIEVLPGVGVQLGYSVGGAAVAPYTVRVDYDRPHFGGRRAWWLCPGCGRRARKLYGGRLFLCRTCHGLTYAICSQRGAEAVATAARNKRRRLAVRLQANLSQAYPGKPRSMQWQTYLRLIETWRDLAGVEELMRDVSLAEVVGVQFPAAYSPRRLWEASKAQAAACEAIDHSEAASWLAKEGRRRVRPRPALLTLSDLAERAGVDVSFARGAVRAKLLRADSGRGTRSAHYRPRLASWLAKLAKLRAEGHSWADIRAWTKRRWQPGHEQERFWPASRNPKEARKPHDSDTSAGIPR